MALLPGSWYVDARVAALINLVSSYLTTFAAFVDQMPPMARHRRWNPDHSINSDNARLTHSARNLWPRLEEDDPGGTLGIIICARSCRCHHRLITPVPVYNALQRYKPLQPTTTQRQPTTAYDHPWVTPFRKLREASDQQQRRSTNPNEYE